MRKPRSPRDPDSDPLRSLAVAANAGDSDALRALLVAVAPSLLRIVRGVLGPWQSEVEDVAQEATTAIVRALPSFRGESSVLHFACRIAVFTALDERRRIRRRDNALLGFQDFDT